MTVMHTKRRKKKRRNSVELNRPKAICKIAQPQDLSCVPEHNFCVLRGLGRSLNKHETVGFRKSGNWQFSQSGYLFALLAAFLFPISSTPISPKQNGSTAFRFIRWLYSRSFFVLSFYVGQKRMEWISAVAGVVGMCVNCLSRRCCGKPVCRLWERPVLFHGL